MTHFWYTPTAQGTSRTGLFWDMDNWTGIGGKINSSADFEIFVFFYLLYLFVCLFVVVVVVIVFYHLHAFSNWFSNIFPPKKIQHFLQPVTFTTIEYRSVTSSNFVFAFQHFHDHISVEHDENPHTPNFTWISSWGARDMTAWIPNWPGS